jgi:uncharacterized protein
MSTRILVFAKAPQPGQVKTRLIPALGADGAAALARRMLQHTLAEALAAGIGPVELCASPGVAHADWLGVPLPTGIECSEQGSGDLGERLARASRRVLDSATNRALQTSSAAMLIGTDCPALDAATLRQAEQQLAQHDAVLIPATDGGYCLLGMKRHDDSLFSAMPWSTSAVANITLQRCAALGWQLWQGAPLTDIDEPADMVALPPGWRIGTI